MEDLEENTPGKVVEGGRKSSEGWVGAGGSSTSRGMEPRITEGEKMRRKDGETVTSP